VRPSSACAPRTPESSLHLPSIARAQFRQHGLEPVRVPGGFDPHSHRSLQRRVKSSRLAVLVLQTPLHFLARLHIQHRDLLVACMQITPYNHHRSAPFLRALVALSASKSTRP
jgi:hypothetical protein